jgi:ribosomal protein S18 acetylase RimI-like enzyme
MKTETEINPFERADESRLRAFFESLADVDRTFIHADVLRPGVIESWIAEAGTSRDRRYVATVGDEIVGYLAVLPETDWSAHVAVLRIVVRPSHRRRGVASELARHAVVSAARDGIKKLVVEVVSDQDATIAMFTGLGFEAEGLLREHLIGEGGETHDLLVLSQFVDELSATLTTTGVEQAVTS